MNLLGLITLNLKKLTAHTGSLLCDRENVHFKNGEGRRQVSMIYTTLENVLGQ